MDYGFQYIEDNAGIDTEDDYPYHAKDQICDSSKAAHHVVTISGFHDVPANNPSQLEQAVTKGPVSIAIEADKSVFQLYHDGVFDDSGCGTQLDHGVLVVGYGTDSSEGKDYWIVKNSWGAAWGEQGYIRMVKEASGMGMCGMYKQPSYPDTGSSGPTPLHDPLPLLDHQVVHMRIQRTDADLVKWPSKFKEFLDLSAHQDAKGRWILVQTR